jgi:transcriptional regulator with XRE-family HTH domain
VTDLNSRRLALGDQLRLFRESAGLSGKMLAEQLSWQPSKISRIENARQAVTDSDLVSLCDVFGATDDQADELRNELRAIRVEEARWNRQLRVGHREIQDRVSEIEQVAQSIDVFSLTLVPGLLQTAEYARNVFVSLAELHDSLPDTDAAVRARMERQQILYTDDKRIALLMTEYGLRNPIAPAPVMRAQVDRLIALQGLPSVRFGILPIARTIPAAVAHSFTIKDDLVAVELLNTEITTREATDLALYRNYLAKLWDVAAEGDTARALLLEVSASYQRDSQ